VGLATLAALEHAAPALLRRHPQLLSDFFPVLLQVGADWVEVRTLL
jgi:hypothetical protein